MKDNATRDLLDQKSARRGYEAQISAIDVRDRIPVIRDRRIDKAVDAMNLRRRHDD